VFRGKYLGNPVAAKQVHNSEDNMEDFHREVAMLTKISHPCIMALFGVTKDADGEIYMVLEYCGGGDLGKYYKHASFTKLEFNRVVTEILSGVVYLHERQITHRDLKPDNILLEAVSRRVKIGDFGLSRGTNNTNTRGVGTPAYMVSCSPLHSALSMRY
jgi:serine/threonine protein kinase